MILASSAGTAEKDTLTRRTYFRRMRAEFTVPLPATPNSICLLLEYRISIDPAATAVTLTHSKFRGSHCLGDVAHKHARCRCWDLKLERLVRNQTHILTAQLANGKYSRSDKHIKVSFINVTLFYTVLHIIQSYLHESPTFYISCSIRYLPLPLLSSCTIAHHGF